MRALSFSLSLIILGCSTPNPQYCGDGTCTDPRFPFCDIDGTLSGSPQTCVTVACTAMEFQACRGDNELRCNADGTNYDVNQCAQGCDTSTGCRTCSTGASCVNGVAQTCDANGAVTSTEACPLGCDDQQPRCRTIAPSNALAAYMDMAAQGPDLVLDSTVLYVPSGTYGDRILSSLTVPGIGDAPPIQVFPVKSLTIRGPVRIRRDAAPYTAAPAIAFVVYDDVDLDGALLLLGDASGTTPPPGAIVAGGCVGGPGDLDNAGSVFCFAGGGGGGAAMRGADGGGQLPLLAASPGGRPMSTPDLQPLVGGCAGGSPPGYQPAGHGGGALQISSRTKIHLAANASIHADGAIGYARTMPLTTLPDLESIPGGGGGGGSILLEAPAIELDRGVTMTANGGGGTSGDSHAANPTSAHAPSTGGVCEASNSGFCSNGGNGGALGAAATSAASIAYQGQRQLYTGGGGGSIGTIRINTAIGTFTQANDVFLSPTPSAGMIATR